LNNSLAYPDKISIPEVRKNSYNVVQEIQGKGRTAINMNGTLSTFPARVVGVTHGTILAEAVMISLCDKS
jgi:hypothetical protein